MSIETFISKVDEFEKAAADEAESQEAALKAAADERADAHADLIEEEIESERIRTESSERGMCFWIFLMAA